MMYMRQCTLKTLQSPSCLHREALLYTGEAHLAATRNRQPGEEHSSSQSFWAVQFEGVYHQKRGKRIADCAC